MVVALWGGVGVESRFVLAGCKVSVVCFRVKNLSSKGWVSVAGSDGVLYGILHGAGNAMLMRGGACAAELRLMEVRVGSSCAIVCVLDL